MVLELRDEFRTYKLYKTNYCRESFMSIKDGRINYSEAPFICAKEGYDTIYCCDSRENVEFDEVYDLNLKRWVKQGKEEKTLESWVPDQIFYRMENEGKAVS